MVPEDGPMKIWNTIRFKILGLVFSLALCSLLLTSLLIFFLLFQTLIQTETKNAISSSDKVRQNIEFVIRLVTNTGTLLGNSQDLLTQLNRPPRRQSRAFQEGQVKISEMLRNIIIVQEYIKAIYVISPAGDLYSSMSVDEDEFRKTYSEIFSGEPQQHDSFSGIHPVHYQANTESSVISYIRPIFDTGTGNVMGTIIIDLDYEHMKELFTISSIQQDEFVIVLGTRGDIIFNYPYNVVLDDIVSENPGLFKKDQVQLLNTVFGKESILVSQTINYTDWRIIRVLSSYAVHQETSFLESVAFFSFFLFLILTFLASLRIASFVTKPIEDLSQKLKLVENGDLTARVQVRSKDEVGELGRSFNRMVSQLDGLIQGQLVEQKRKARLEFEILQAQINPHFLYNSLDSIKWLAVINNVGTIGEMTTALINMLKYNISRKEAVVSLEEELESVSNYVIMQKFRYGNVFEVDLTIDPRTSSCKVLRFFLQPLVENALLHGFEKADGIGTIVIRSRLEGAMLVITVEDNGVGIGDDQLSELNRNAVEASKFNGIGIQNIQERIKLYFGDPYGLSFESQIGSGTVVVVTFPSFPTTEDDRELTVSRILS